MKAKLRITILFFLLCTEVSFSQILIGPVAGGNVSWVSFGDKDYKDLYSVKQVYGYHAGAQVSFRVRKRFYLHTSLIYSTKGKKLQGKEEKLELTARYNFIEMPIVYTVNFKGTIGKKTFRYFAGIGPNVSYWLGGKGEIENIDTHEFSEVGSVVDYKIKFGGDPEHIGDREMIVKRANRVQLGLNFTLGTVFEPAQDRELMLTLRYEYGHSFMTREDGNGLFKATYYEDIMATRNQGFRLSLAYLIDLKTDQRKKGKTNFDKKKF